MISLTDSEFTRVKDFIFDAAGISLSGSKKTLVCGRLERRLNHHRLASYSDYLALLASKRDPDELQLAVDLLTTNETYFFREPRHFDLLRDLARAARERGQALRVWSAACSSGEEAYSAAMVLADCQGELGWEVLGSDLSQRVLERARAGHYSDERVDHLPIAYRQRFCLRGTGEHAGTLLMQRALRQRVRFVQVNLNRTLPQLGGFDLIFLRNVMIYFSDDTKRQVVARLLPLLRRGGHLLIGHSETLHGLSDELVSVTPSVYRKP